MEEKVPGAVSARTACIVCGVLILGFLILAPLCGLGKSPSADENRYSGFGKYLLATAELDNLLLLDQPPLPYLIISAPFFFLDTPPASGEKRDRMYHSRLGRDFIFRNSVPPYTVLLIGRSMVAFCGAILAAVLGLLAHRRYGGGAAILVVALFCLSPNLLAHGSQMTSDVIGALFFTLGALAWAAFLETPTWRGAGLAGAALGLALLAKVSGLLLLPGVAVAGLVRLLYCARGSRLRLFGSAVAKGAPAVILAGIVVWAGYGFDVGPVIPADDDRLSEKLWLDHWQGRTRELLTEVGVPAPGYARLLMYVGRHSRRGHMSFMNGEVSATGFPLFYPYCLAVKVPLATLVLLLLLGVSFVRRPPDMREATLLSVCVVFFVFSMRSKVNVGIRHILPMLPLLFLLIGRLPLVFPRRWFSVVAVGAVLWNAGSVISAAPHFLAYFNVAAGGPSSGYRRLVDSNLDWGQDLLGLKRYLDEQGAGEVRLSYFGAIDPGEYDIRWKPVETVAGMDGMTEDELAEVNPGWVAISATNLQNVYRGKYGDLSWARRLTPRAVIGHSIFVYRLEPARGSREGR